MKPFSHSLSFIPKSFTKNHLKSRTETFLPSFFSALIIAKLYFEFVRAPKIELFILFESPFLLLRRLILTIIITPLNHLAQDAHHSKVVRKVRTCRSHQTHRVPDFGPQVTQAHQEDCTCQRYTSYPKMKQAECH